MATNKDTGLFAKTLMAIAGEVAAFISHSWSDNGEAKWTRLCEWVGERQAAGHGSDPLLWLDKACIDQSNIQASLAGLPIFLEACQQLLVLVGQSYTTRLWCVMELYVFVRMKGGTDRMVVMLLSDDDEHLMEQLQRFDAGQAQCFLKQDRERLLAVIEASFGTVRPFNKQMRHLLLFAAEHSVNLRQQEPIPLPAACDALEPEADISVAQVPHQGLQRGSFASAPSDTEGPLFARNALFREVVARSSDGPVAAVLGRESSDDSLGRLDASI